MGLDIKRQGAIAEREIAKNYNDYGWYVEKWPTNPGGFDFWLFNVADYNHPVPRGDVMVVEIKANHQKKISPVQNCARRIIEEGYGIRYQVEFFDLGIGNVPSPWMYNTVKNYKMDYAMHQPMRNRLNEWKKVFEEIRLNIKKYCKKH